MSVMTRSPTRPMAMWSGSAIAKGRVDFDRSRCGESRARRARDRDGRECRQARAKASTTRRSCSAALNIEHYHQAIAVVIAETFEQARDAAQLVRVEYSDITGAFDLAAAEDDGEKAEGRRHQRRARDRYRRFRSRVHCGAGQLDATYTTPDQAHAMMEPHASTAVWNGGRLTL